MKAQDLKNSILQLAIQGKLVPQDASDEHAEVLYAKIQAEKQKLIKEGKIKKDKPLPPIADDEIPFEIPSTWKWVRLGDVASMYTGNSIPEDVKSRKYTSISEGYDYIGTKDVNFNQTVNYDNGVKIPYHEPKFKLAHKNSILMCIEGGSAGRKIALLDRTVCFGNKLCAINVINMSELYIMNILQSTYFRAIFNDNTAGIIGGVSINKFQDLLIPLPPSSEQKRIVAKIEELEPFVKQYDKAETELSALNGSFPEQLKKSILQYAIQGKLVAQVDNDEPAEVLYAKIQAEKQKLLKEGKIKKDKHLSPITDDEIPFEIPPSWKWVRLNDLVDAIRGITYGIVKMEYEPTEGVKALRCSDVQYRYIDITKVRLVDYEISEQYSRTILQGGELLINIRGTLGGCAIVPEKLKGYNIAREIAMVPLMQYANKEYVLDVISSPYFQDKILGNLRGIAYKGLNLNILSNLLIPLPPLAEQHRIVAKVNDLMQYCEELAHPEKRKSVEPITIEWLIDKGFDSCKQNGYTDVNAILDELNIAVMQDRSLKKGRIEYDNNKKKFQIWVKDLNDNWTKTHELVHYVNDNNEIKLYGAVGRKDETSLSKSKEHNVDVLTAEILMPEDIFVSAVEQDNIRKYAFVDNTIVRKLSKQFRVSDDAVKIRLQNLGYHTK